MSSYGRPDDDVVFDCHSMRVAVVAARWHQPVMEGLLAGTTAALEQHQVESPVIKRVPGSFELPVVAAALASQGFNAIITLGVVIRGETPHFDYVCRAATDGLTRVSLDYGVPIGFGVLTCDTEAQAFARTVLEPIGDNKGFQATAAALQTAASLQQIRRLQH